MSPLVLACCIDALWGKSKGQHVMPPLTGTQRAHVEFLPERPQFYSLGEDDQPLCIQTCIRSLTQLKDVGK